MTTASTGVSVGREPELLGQTVILIGGSAGIGLETARRARAEGADVESLSDHVVLGLEVARNAAGKMRAGGTLLLMGGTGGRRIGRDLGIASAATAVLPPFVAALALELAPVRVNLIAAGFIDTPLSASYFSSEGQQLGSALIRS